MWEQEAARLHDVLHRLSDSRLAGEIGAELGLNAHVIANQSAELIRSEIPDYALIMSGGDLSETWQHGRQHAEQIAFMLESRSLGDLDFVRRLARRRAEQRFPLRHVLHTYRIGHRVTWAFVQGCLERSDQPRAELMPASMVLFDFTIQYTNLISVTAAGAYDDRRRELGNVTQRRTRALFEALVHGLPLDPEVLSLARAGGWGAGPLHLLVLRREDRLDAGDMAATLAALTEHAGSGSGSGSLLASALDDELLCLVPVGSPRPDADVRLVLHETGLDGFAERYGLCIGVSHALTLAAQGRSAYREALHAASLADENNRIVWIGEVPLTDLAIERGDLDIARLLPGWLRRWQKLPAGTRADLEKTLAAFADADLHVRAAAAAVGVHPNTIGFRLTKIEDLTGLSPRRFHDLTEIRTALRLGGTPLPETAA